MIRQHSIEAFLPPLPFGKRTGTTGTIIPAGDWHKNKNPQSPTLAPGVFKLTAF
jgi:hypothetical protein